MRTIPRHILLATALGASVALAAPACAQHDDHNYHGHEGHPGHADFHGRDYHAFTPHDMGVWRGGQWVHGWHDGRYAWWWNVDGGWYFYPAPIYPFPTYVPPAIVVQQAPPVPTGLPPAQFWYYCDNPQGYYPYVAACSGPWRQVPVGPPQ